MNASHFAKLLTRLVNSIFFRSNCICIDDRDF